MKKKLLVQTTRNKDGDVVNRDLFDLFYEENGDRVVIQYSPLDKKWTTPGKNAAVLKSDGNGFDVTLTGGKDRPDQKVRLDYAAADHLRVLLHVHMLLYRKSLRPGLNIEKDRFVNKLSDIDKPKFVNKLSDIDKPKKPKMRPLGDIISDLEEIIQEMVDDHDLQWGDILSLTHGYLRVHNPEAQEQYVEGGSPEFYYGPKREE